MVKPSATYPEVTLAEVSDCYRPKIDIHAGIFSGPFFVLRVSLNNPCIVAILLSTTAFFSSVAAERRWEIPSSSSGTPAQQDGYSDLSLPFSVPTPSARWIDITGTHSDK
ncbi:hypothetical protein J6590_028221 [Homalodisca vitripennis]|nr:hypothetical protein J6590_028221 [Homalodisca vitripennis]